jgi:hypothetical protein
LNLFQIPRSQPNARPQEEIMTPTYEEKRVEQEPSPRKPYAKPEILYELELETRAGSTIDGMPWTGEEDIP